jgi:hypothetical protein
VRLAIILDLSALLSFARRTDVAVGELVGEVADEQAFVGVPVSSAAVAYASLSTPEQHAMFAVLIDRNLSVVVLPMLADDSRLIGEYTAGLGQRLELAHAVREAERNQAQLATAEGDLVRKAFGELYGIVDL